MSEYRVTIGLEIHAELATRTKMFCACRNDPDEKTPNKNICPVCMAHPGSLPVINREAVHKVLLVGAALGGTLADFSEFDRKNYFYPDIPKGYQISQYKYPLVVGGSLSGVSLTRVHLEEDTARSIHDLASQKIPQTFVSLVDYNRAGVPLMELVTEPVIHSAEEAGMFARELQLLLRHLGAGEAHMEKGEMRVEANISVAKNQGQTLDQGSPRSDLSKVEPLKLGTKVEVKNLNSFRSVERAIAYETKRQSALLAEGKQVTQETRGWDEAKQTTFSQRKKESSHDYRYFPDPDLPKLLLSEIPEFSSGRLAQELRGALPWEKRQHYKDAYGLKADDADMFVRDSILGDFFDTVVLGYGHDDLRELGLITANYIASDLAGAREKGEVKEMWFTDANARRVSALMLMVHRGELSSRGAKDTLAHMFADTRAPEDIARSHALLQESGQHLLLGIVKKVISEHHAVAANYRAGKSAALQFLIGQGMKEAKGSANPSVLGTLFKQELE